MSGRKRFWLATDEQKDELPRDRQADEAVDVFLVRDGGWPVTADAFGGEVLRRHDEHSIDAGAAKRPCGRIDLPAAGARTRPAASAMMACGSLSPRRTRDTHRPADTRTEQPARAARRKSRRTPPERARRTRRPSQASIPRGVQKHTCVVIHPHRPVRFGPE
jgi:hypothetical protein